MLIERIKTSLIMPKLIFGVTIFVFMLCASAVYALIAFEPSTIIQEGTMITDEITARVFTNGGL